MNQIDLEKIVREIDAGFGDELAFTDQPLGPQDQETLNRIFGDSGFQRYLQDQINRQVIRDYLANAIALGYLAASDLDRVVGRIASLEGRAALSLQMLMHGVEQAPDLLSEDTETLYLLKEDPGKGPDIHLVSS